MKKIGILTVIVMMGAGFALGPVEYAVSESAADCLAADSTLVYYAQRLATDTTDSMLQASREDFDIQPVPLSEVERVLDPSVCTDAARAYKSALGLKGKAPDVEVVRIGNRYIVVSPAGQADESEFVTHVVFDLQFNEIASFVA